MQNIHLIPTTPNDETARGIWIKETRDWCHIYITDNSEIREGDWLFANQGVNKIVEIKKGDYPYGSINNKGHKIFNSKHWKSKIILTTNEKLIKDGIQQIDDEFLEWFLKNPTCEFVKIETIWVAGNSEEDLYSYKPVISKEESKYISTIEKMKPFQEQWQRSIEASLNPKQDRTCTNNCSVVCGECQIFESKQLIQEQGFAYVCLHTMKPCNDECCISANGCYIITSLNSGIVGKESKQESLKEAAEILFPIFNRSTAFGDKYPWTPKKEREAFIKGAKWQAEQLFKDDIIQTLEKGLTLLLKKQERMYNSLSELRNELYDKLPTGNVDALELLKLIKIHLQKLDDLCGNK